MVKPLLEVWPVFYRECDHEGHQVRVHLHDIAVTLQVNTEHPNTTAHRAKVTEHELLAEIGPDQASFIFELILQPAKVIRKVQPGATST